MSVYEVHLGSWRRGPNGEFLNYREIARQLCAGLGAAHDRGVLHRDLKPANVMIDGSGQVRITDFGIASLADQRDEDGILAGTLPFMAPELLDGQQKLSCTQRETSVIVA